MENSIAGKQKVFPLVAYLSAFSLSASDWHFQRSISVQLVPCISARPLA